MKNFLVLFCIGIAAEASVWGAIIFPQNDRSSLFFLDVGQGDAQLLSLPGDLQMLVDTGPDGRIVSRELRQAIGADDHYLDLVLITHTEKDHYSGLSGLLQEYEVGAILWNGRRPDDPNSGWNELETEIKRRGIPMIAIRKGDILTLGGARSEILSPDLDLVSSGALNEGSVIQRLTIGSVRAILAADAGITAENRLPATELAADILKVGHHGSKFSSGERFLSGVSPRIAVIQVGEGNNYGHPSPEFFDRLIKTASTTVFRTDRNGLIELRFEPGGIRIFTERNETGYN